MHQWNACDYAALFLSLAMYAVYVYMLIWRKKRSTISTWLCWLFLDILVLSGMHGTKEGMTPQMLAYTAGTSTVVLVCLWRRASLGWQWYDGVCASLTLIAGGLWVLSKSPYVAVVLGLVAMTVASVPLIANAWREPEDEPLLAWLLNLGGAIASVLAITEWGLGHASEPVLLVLSLIFNVVISRQYWPSRSKLMHQALLLD